MSARYKSRFKSAYLWAGAIFVFMLIVSAKFPIGQKLSIAMGPVLHVVQAPTRWYRDFSLWFENSSDLQYRYQHLKADFDEQHALAQKVSALKTENKQLRQLLRITQIDEYVWHASRVISRGQEERSRRLTLQTEQVNPDDIVVSHEGLVGIIDNASQQYAVVRTILDASLAVPVTMDNSSLVALVRGAGDRLLVDFVPRSNAPKVGDTLITSGAGGLFPAGLPVAVVEKVTAVEGGVFVEVNATPSAKWERDAWLAVAKRKQP